MHNTSCIILYYYYMNWLMIAQTIIWNELFSPQCIRLVIQIHYDRHKITEVPNSNAYVQTRPADE